MNIFGPIVGIQNENISILKIDFEKFQLESSFDTVAPDTLRHFMCAGDHGDDESDGKEEDDDDADSEEDVVPHLAVSTEDMHVS